MNCEEKFYSRTSSKKEEKELLEIHLKKTAKLCSEYAEEFGEKDAGF